MNNIHKYLLPAFLFLFSVSLQAQEIISGLQYQPSKQGKWLPLKNSKGLSLPFLDDFSNKLSFPDPSKWIDNEVFINNDYPLEPPSYGVATFDAVDGDGDFYEGSGPFQFEADHLTSAFIDISSLSPADSLYFSFRFQPQGKGNAPESSDSLVLDFLIEYRSDTVVDTTVTPYDTTFYDTWQRVWSSSGMSVENFYAENNRYFKQVMIPVLDNVFFRDDFRFRFRNYASLASNNIPSWQSNCDQWNIDYVYLNSGRSAGDTLFNDMCFVNKGSSFLKNYTSMPFRQFVADSADEMRDSTQNMISNLGDDIMICKYKFIIKNMSGSEIYNYAGGEWNLDPFYSSGYQTYKRHAVPDFHDFNFPVSSDDSASFLIIHSIERTGAVQELIRSNDSIFYLQKFLNYYSYDDGIPEYGYGLSPSGAQLAYGFHLNIKDTLKGVLIAFNKTLNEANLENFYLGVYKNNNGKPGELIFRNEYPRKAAINDTSLFYYYEFESEDPIILYANSTYYIGIIQTTEDNLNIGFDINNDANSHIFYNVDGSWNKSEYHGAIMIRPVIGPSYQYGSKKIDMKQDELLVYPNPASGSFNIQLPLNNNDINNYQLSIYSITGQLVAKRQAQAENSLTGIRSGLYFVELHNERSGAVYRSKILVTNRLKDESGK